MPNKKAPGRRQPTKKGAIEKTIFQLYFQNRNLKREKEKKFITCVYLLQKTIIGGKKNEKI